LSLVLAQITATSVAQLGLAPGAPVFAQVKGMVLLD